MAGFKTHVTFSSLLGVGYGTAGLLALDLPLPTCVLASGLCGVAGMLPDLDSDNGVPLRETLTFGAAIVPMFMLERFALWGLSAESMVIAAAAMYLFVRFALGWFLKQCTVHRGMFHSLPAATIAGLLAFLLCQSQEMDVRIYKAGGVVLGFLSHLLLDEMYSIDVAKLRVKKSFGTALKLYSRDFLADAFTYGAMIGLTWLAIKDPTWMEQFHPFHRADDVAQQTAGDDTAPVATKVKPNRHTLTESLLDRLRR